MNALLLSTLLLPALASTAAAETAPEVPTETSTETATEPSTDATTETTPNTDAVPGVHLFEIDAHTTGVYIPDHRTPLVDIWVQVPVGHWDEGTTEAKSSKPGSTRSTTRMPLCAAGPTPTPWALCGGEDRSQHPVPGLPRRRPSRSQTLLKDIFTNRTYDEKQFEREAKANEKAWELEQKDPSTVRSRAVFKLAFTDTDPRQLDLAPHTLPVRDSEALATLRDRMLQTPGRYVAFAGDLTLEQARDFAADLLPPADPSITWTETALEPVQDRPARHTVPIANTNQAYLDYFTLSPTNRDPNQPAWMVAQHVLGGHSYSRIAVALRHEDGDTYSASTYSSMEATPKPAGMVTFTRADNLDATEQLKDTLATFHTGGITAEELDDAVRYFRGKALMRTQTPKQLDVRCTTSETTGPSAGTVATRRRWSSSRSTR